MLMTRTSRVLRRWVPRIWTYAAVIYFALFIMCFVLSEKRHMMMIRREIYETKRGMNYFHNSNDTFLPASGWKAKKHTSETTLQRIKNHRYILRASDGTLNEGKANGYRKIQYQNNYQQLKRTTPHDSEIIKQYLPKGMIPRKINQDGINQFPDRESKRINSFDMKHLQNQLGYKGPQVANMDIPRLVFGNSGLGQNGAPVTISKSQLRREDQELWDQGYSRHDFNEYISDLISVDRTITEVRDPRCLNLTYPTDLPDTSVIITFLNEAWSVLVRSVHSIINTSPPHLLMEIILVDDFSEYAHLKEPLDIYMTKFPKVKILRNEKREGLIRSRLRGAEIAKGKVLTFLDSHIECAKGWLPPLLSRIKQNVSHVVWPAVPGIDRHTFEFYVHRDASTIQVGGFNWKLMYTWYRPQVEERESPVSPIRSPTMAGGLFSIDREYFYHIGSYDDQMQYWGGENLEISFRIWMCGGHIEVIPCSVVGHVFRSRNVNSNAMTAGKSTKNLVRTATVWMDEYKHLFAKVANVNLENSGDISSRIKLRRSLQCKSFSWYLDNVYSVIFRPRKAISSGLLRNGWSSRRCLKAVDAIRNPIRLGVCNSLDFKRQVFHKTREEELRLLDTCVDVGSQDPIMFPCHRLKGTQFLVHREDRSLFSPWAGKCLEWLESSRNVGLRNCSGTTRQMWTWDEKKFIF